jgi:Asp-tRNA(Asn)/Glu-tRNA(Gln) amidotransferase C subunit
MLRRYTGLNHLAQAARAVLQNSSQVSQMLNDLNKVDFTNVQEQVTVLDNTRVKRELNFCNGYLGLLYFRD